MAEIKASTNTVLAQQDRIWPKVINLSADHCVQNYFVAHYLHTVCWLHYGP